MAKLQADKIKICFHLPIYDANTDSHFYHVYELIDALSDDFDTCVIFEKSRGEVMLRESVLVVRQRYSSSVARFCENLFLTMVAHLRGYRIHYSRYGVIGNLNSVLITRLLGGKSIIWHCGMPDWGGMGEQFRYKLPFRLYSIFCSNFLTGTRGMAEYYRTEHGVDLRKITVIPNWINVRRFNTDTLTPPSSTAPVILFVHKLDASRGARWLVPLALRLTKHGIQFTLRICGRGNAYTQLVREIADANLEMKVDLCGSIPNQDVPRIMAGSTILVMPSDREGFPRVLLEAMASGLPVAASAVGGVREILPPEQLEFVFETDDFEKFVSSVERLLEEPEKRHSLSETNRKWVRMFDLPIVAEQYRSFVHSLVVDGRSET